VLLVDESRQSRTLLERSAGGMNATVHHARSVNDAFWHAMNFSYDALLVDSTLAGDSTLSLLERLRTMQGAAAVLLSGEGLRFPPGFALQGNLLGSLKKPWDPEELEAALWRCFELSRARRARRARQRASRVCFERVLLVGTSAGMRRVSQMVRGWVGKGGLVQASSLEEALVLLGQQSFDVALTDLCLPDAYGLDAVVRIRRSESPVPLVVLTAGQDLAWSDQALQAGAQDVLCKGEIDTANLIRSMRHARGRQRAQARLQHGALHDELTSLAKRTLLHQRIANALARSRRMGNTFAVIYIDLDHFKSINDTHGHDVGDAVLVAVSNRLRAAVREYDTVARLGGDEFAILLDTLDDPAEAETVAQRVLCSLAPPVRVSQHDLEVTASMGISVFPRGGTAADELLRSADQAMYCAKRAGRNTYSLTPLVDEAALTGSAVSSPAAPC
jgi:diguanylate cyclase (GGDEF)-like protein